jgi:hypothetical protein
MYPAGELHAVAAVTLGALFAFGVELLGFDQG